MVTKGVKTFLTSRQPEHSCSGISDEYEMHYKLKAEHTVVRVKHIAYRVSSLGSI